MQTKLKTNDNTNSEKKNMKNQKVKNLKNILES
jgi:hypothetical protein